MFGCIKIVLFISVRGIKVTSSTTYTEYSLFQNVSMIGHAPGGDIIRAIKLVTPISNAHVYLFCDIILISDQMFGFFFLP